MADLMFCITVSMQDHLNGSINSKDFKGEDNMSASEITIRNLNDTLHKNNQKHQSSTFNLKGSNHEAHFPPCFEMTDFKKPGCIIFIY